MKVKEQVIDLIITTLATTLFSILKNMRKKKYGTKDGGNIVKQNTP